MGYAELIKAVEQEGRREQERILQEARKRAEEILQRARKEALKTKEALLEKARAELRGRESEAVNRARAEARKMVLTARQEILDEVFKKAIGRIRGLPPDDYGAIIKGLFDELLKDWQTSGMEEDPVVYVAEEDARFLEGVVYDVVPTKEVAAGVVFESRDKKYRAENTLGSRLTRLRPDLMVALKGILFEESLR